MLTHDTKFDVPAIIAALRQGRLPGGDGLTRRPTPSAVARLVEAGVADEAELARVMGPIGLDIGARTPEETAVSICAEIIAMRTGRYRARPSASATGRSTRRRRAYEDRRPVVLAAGGGSRFGGADHKLRGDHRGAARSVSWAARARRCRRARPDRGSYRRRRPRAAAAGGSPTASGAEQPALGDVARRRRCRLAVAAAERPRFDAIVVAWATCR